MNPHLDFLLSVVYDHDGTDLHPPHRADLEKSGITAATVVLQKIRSVPPADFDHLFGFQVPSAITSMMLLPFPDPRGGWMDFPRAKVFPPFVTPKGTVKYFQRRGAGCRLFFPLVTLDRALHTDEVLWLVEGEKKSLAVAQLGLPAVGFCGIEGWHVAGSRALCPDFDHLALAGRPVTLVPDGDWRINAHVARGAARFARALEDRGARVETVVLPALAPSAA